MKPDPDSPTVIVKYANEFDAWAIVDHLRERGFRPKLCGTYYMWGEGPSDGIEIVVRQSEADAARIAVKAFLAART